MIIVVPARGGSKRFPQKNMYPLGHKPLLAHTLELIECSGLNIPTYVSTDDDKIAALARSFPGIEVIIRPPNLATDNASTESVLLHVLDFLTKRGDSPQWLMTLPPTSPFRTPSTLRAFVKAAAECPSDVDCLMSVTENRDDLWKMSDNGQIRRLFPNAPRRQQDRLPLFIENSAVYVSRTEALLNTGSILGRAVHGIKISAIEGFDINSSEDMIFAECLYKKIIKNKSYAEQ